jgi:hypothetical protein
LCGPSSKVRATFFVGFGVAVDVDEVVFVVVEADVVFVILDVDGTAVHPVRKNIAEIRQSEIFIKKRLRDEILNIE